METKNSTAVHKAWEYCQNMYVKSNGQTSTIMIWINIPFFNVHVQCMSVLQISYCGSCKDTTTTTKCDGRMHVRMSQRTDKGKTICTFPVRSGGIKCL